MDAVKDGVIYLFVAVHFRFTFIFTLILNCIERIKRSAKKGPAAAAKWTTSRTGPQRDGGLWESVW